MVDCSRYTGPITAAWVQACRAAGVVRFIVQAHPPGYGDDIALQQMGVLTAEGMPWGSYVYEYLASPDWTDGALQTLDTAAASGNVPDRLYLDIEDVSASAVALSVSQRLQAIDADFAKLDNWSATKGASGMAPADLYTGAWWWDQYLPGASGYVDRGLWFSSYDGIADPTVFTPFGGWTVAAGKQYVGSTSIAGVWSVDLSVFA